MITQLKKAHRSPSGLAIFALAAASLLGLSGPARADDNNGPASPKLPISALVAAGGGLETNFQGGKNMLLEVEFGIGTGGNPCTFGDAVCLFRRSQVVWVHIEGEGSYDLNAKGGEQVPYVNGRVTLAAIPLNAQKTEVITDSRWTKFGAERSVQVIVGRADLDRDRTFPKDLSVRAHVIGLDAVLQTFPTQVLGVYIQGAVDAIGTRVLKSAEAKAGADAAELARVAKMPEGWQVSIGTADVRAGIILMATQAFVLRATGGAQYSMAVAKQYGVQNEVSVFGELSLSASRLFDVNGRISKSWEDFGDQTLDVTRATVNARFKFDW